MTIKETTPLPLSGEQFSQIVKLTPLVSIDLVVRDDMQRMLVGLRENRPAQGYWFVPGGRIAKNERIEQAFHRICETELGRALPLSEGRFLGVFEHLYEDNFAGVPGFGTHYVVLAYSIDGNPDDFNLPQIQHSNYAWMHESEILTRQDAHPYIRDYCGR